MLEKLQTRFNCHSRKELLLLGWLPDLAADRKQATPFLPPFSPLVSLWRPLLAETSWLSKEKCAVHFLRELILPFFCLYLHVFLSTGFYFPHQQFKWTNLSYPKNKLNRHPLWVKGTQFILLLKQLKNIDKTYGKNEPEDIGHQVTRAIP